MPLASCSYEAAKEAADTAKVRQSHQISIGRIDGIRATRNPSIPKWKGVHLLRMPSLQQALVEIALLEKKKSVEEKSAIVHIWGDVT